MPSCPGSRSRLWETTWPRKSDWSWDGVRRCSSNAATSSRLMSVMTNSAPSRSPPGRTTNVRSGTVNVDMPSPSADRREAVDEADLEVLGGVLERDELDLLGAHAVDVGLLDVIDDAPGVELELVVAPAERGPRRDDPDLPLRLRVVRRALGVGLEEAGEAEFPGHRVRAGDLDARRRRVERVGDDETVVELPLGLDDVGFGGAADRGRVDVDRGRRAEDGGEAELGGGSGEGADLDRGLGGHEIDRVGDGLVLLVREREARRHEVVELPQGRAARDAPPQRRDLEIVGGVGRRKR